MICDDVDQALSLMGGFGKHQWIIWFINMMCLALGDFQLYPSAFYEKEPEYLCSSTFNAINKQWVDYEHCDNIDFCANLLEHHSDTLPQHKIDYDSKFTLYNWI